MMRLHTLLETAELPAEVAAGADLGVEVVRVVADSRLVRPGDLFVAANGARHRGVDHVPAALQAGAVALVVDAPVSLAQCEAWNVPVVRVSRARSAIGPLAAALWGHPSRRLQVIGVTGTNGKTTTAVLIAQLCNAAGGKAAAIGTLGTWTAEGVRPGQLTTPEPADLQQNLAQLCAEGFTHVAMEVSSHALDQGRVAGVHFAAAVWTNLSRDHLDYHGTVDHYAGAKARLFSEYGLAWSQCAVNSDDPQASGPWDRGQAQGWSMGGHPAAEHQVCDLRCDAKGLRFILRSADRADLQVAAPLIGRHNAENLTAALLACRMVGLDDAALTSACGHLKAPRGRLEPVANDRGALVVVDYAHTPDALEKVLGALRPLVAPRARLLVVFGCGGDRDAGKRPLMGQVAGQLADLTVVTSDNPRSEQPAAIVAAVVPGLVAAEALELRGLETPHLAALGRRHGFLREVDRGTALRLAIAALQPGDVLCIAGKGHEVTQTIGDQKLPFDDAEVAARWLGFGASGAHSARGQAPAHRQVEPMNPGEFAFDGAAARRACGGHLVAVGSGPTRTLSTDSRQIAPGALFVALAGERFDGGAYVGEVLAHGAAGVVCAVGKGQPHVLAADARGAWLLEVEDPLIALGELARAYRLRFALPVLGVTGSNGKTTTKELAALALSPLGAVLATEGNHNNRIGVPQTVARLGAHHRVAVVEMGMSIPGEIKQLAHIGVPRVAIVTSVAEAHLLGLGTLEAIADEKFDLPRSLPVDGVAILPADEPTLKQRAGQLSCKIVWFGRDLGDVHLLGPVQTGGLDSDAPWQQFRASVGGTAVDVRLPGLGVHLAHNALAALAAAWVLGVDLTQAAAALGDYRPVGQRMLPSRIGPWLVLQDCYNANPRSTATALETLATLPGPRAAVLGAMLELGPREGELHQQVARRAVELGIDLVVAVGPSAAMYAPGITGNHTQFVACNTHAEAAGLLAHRLNAGATLLVKGSRGARMEQVIAALQERFAAAGTQPGRS